MSGNVRDSAPEPAAPLPASAGQLIGGRYRLAARIAGGGMGEVWRGHDETLGCPVAVKLLRPEYCDEPSFLARLRSEARLAGMLHHPGIAAVHDYGEVAADGSAYLVLELVEGESLSTQLHRSGPLSAARTLEVLGQAALALQAAHDAGVVHRDIKPGNLLIRSDGVVKVSDFGIARAVGSAPLTRTGTVLGTAHYLSPEQVHGGPASPASDIYALGIVAYECLAGRRPFEGDSAIEIALAHTRDPIPPLPDTVPRPVAELVSRALEKDAALRPASAGALGRTALAIRAALYDDRPRAAPNPRPSPAASPQPAVRRPTARWRRPPAWGLLALLVLVGCLSVFGVRAGTHGRPAAVVIPSARPSTPGTARTAGTSRAPTVAADAGIAVDPASYHGQPVATALARLRALGLAPTAQTVGQPGPAGTVVTVVTPAGAPLPPRLERGAAVVVQVAAGAPAAGSASVTGGEGEN